MAAAVPRKRFAGVQANRLTVDSRRPSPVAAAYAARIGAENVFFHGEYRPEERYGFARNTDIIHNVYMDKNTMSAMGNKYYDGIIFGIPQICMKGSFMGERCTEAGVGLECRPADPDFTDRVYDYYHGIDISSFCPACDREVMRVTEEYNDGNRFSYTREPDYHRPAA